MVALVQLLAYNWKRYAGKMRKKMRKPDIFLLHQNTKAAALAAAAFSRAVAAG